MNSVQGLALAMALLVSLGIVLLLASPEKYRNILTSLFSFPWVFGALCLFLAVFSLRLLLAELSIVEVFAVMFFLGSLTACGACSFAGDIRVFARKALRDEQVRLKTIPVAIAWGILATWVIIALAGGGPGR